MKRVLLAILDGIIGIGLLLVIVLLIAVIIAIAY